MIKSIPIMQTGMNQINVHAGDLAAGSYAYALIIDGQIVASKTMVRK
jgi:hypothetical protein